MKKFTFVLLFVLILSVFSVLSFSGLTQNEYQNIPNYADSGFDGDYGGDYGGYDDWGGSYGGSSYWDDDDDYYSSSSDRYYSDDDDYSGGGSGDLMIIVYALVGLVAIYALVFGIQHLSAKADRKSKQRSRIKDTLRSYYRLWPGDGKDSDVVQTAYENYVKIQIAWMNRDLTPVRHLLSDEMYNMYQMQLDTLIEDNQINVMTDFQFYCGRVKSKKHPDNIQTIKVLLCVKCKDYIKMANSNKVISGDKGATITYLYELIFVRDLGTEKTMSCPNCGAEVRKQMSGTCKHCNAPLLLTSPEMTLISKKVEEQFKEK